MGCYCREIPFSPPRRPNRRGPGDGGGGGAREHGEAFAFVRFGSPPTNNHAGRRAPGAERALRPLVIFRKVCPGTRRESGSENLAIFASIAETARLRGCDTAEIFETLLTRQPERAHEILFREAAGAG